MAGVAPRPNNKAKRISESILGIPQNQSPRKRPKKQDKINQIDLSELQQRLKT